MGGNDYALDLRRCLPDLCRRRCIWIDMMDAPLQAEPSVTEPVSCPCCKRPVAIPSLEMVAHQFGLTPLETRVLGALWRGKGMPVLSERIFDAIYEDDPDGGPSPNKMYLALKVSLTHIRRKIEKSGVAIEHCGYRRGWKLVISSAYEGIEWNSRRQ